MTGRTVRTLLVLLLGASAFSVKAAAAQPIDAARRAKVIDTILARLNERYVFAEVAKRMAEHVRRQQAAGQYDSIAGGRELAKKLTADLRSISRDGHLAVHFEEEGFRRPGQRRDRRQFTRMAALRNFEFIKVERLPGNVGYLDFRGFMPPELSRDTAAAAFNFLAHTDALIIDMRNNHGGEAAGVALMCSYLFPASPRVHLNDIYSRADERTEQYWTLDEVAGKRYEGKPVWVLTSRGTFSGAEEFTYNLKNLKRATIVGEQTGGGAHPTDFVPVDDNFAVMVPFARAINPITRTNWEGVGVEPDVKVPAAEALKVAHRAAVQTLLEQAASPEDRQRLSEVLTEIAQ